MRNTTGVAWKSPRRLLTAAAACGAAVVLAGPTSLSGQPPDLTIERINSLPSFTGTPPTGVEWSPDGQRVAFLWNQQGWPFRDVYVVPGAGGTPVRLTDLNRTHPAPEASDPDPVRGLAVKAAARARPGASLVTWPPDGRTIAFVYRAHTSPAPCHRARRPRTAPGRRRSRSEWTLCLSASPR